MSNVKERTADLDHLDYMMKQSAAEKVYTEHYNLDEAHASLQSAYQGIIDRNLQFLNSTESIIGIVDPLKTLKRGFSIIKQDGKSIRSVKDIDTAKELEIVMQDGSKKWR